MSRKLSSDAFGIIIMLFLLSAPILSVMSMNVFLYQSPRGKSLPYSPDNGEKTYFTILIEWEKLHSTTATTDILSNCATITLLHGLFCVAVKLECEFNDELFFALWKQKMSRCSAVCMRYYKQLESNHTSFPPTQSGRSFRRLCSAQILFGPLCIRTGLGAELVMS